MIDIDHDILSPEQREAVEQMRNGCILNGGVGSGKSRTALAYYYKECGGFAGVNKWIVPSKAVNLFIITTAMKRDLGDWDTEMLQFRLSRDPDLNPNGVTIVVDSWNNIRKYQDVKQSFFIFDEDRVTGSGVWAKTFIKIARSNSWIICSATPGDKWEDYIPVFIANGFYRNKSHFTREHAIYSPYIRGKIDRYVNTRKLERLRDSILVDIEVKRKTTRIKEDIHAEYDRKMYMSAMRERWDPYKDEPIAQASGLCYVLRKIVNSDDSRQARLLETFFEGHPRLIVFYNFDYERDILLSMDFGDDCEIAEWSGHAHQEIPRSNKWVYLVQYTAGCEGWNCITTDVIVFYSQTYSYKQLEQACGRIDRINTPFEKLYYYTMMSDAPIDRAIKNALRSKRLFNETKFVKGGKPHEHTRYERNPSLDYADYHPGMRYRGSVYSQNS